MITVTVLQDDIDHGKQRHHTRCPIANAFRREHPNLENIQVGRQEVYCFDVRGVLPAEAQRFVDAFDNGRPVQPFKFEIELERR